MLETRSIGLALINIHRGINADFTEVVDRFSKTNECKDFALLFLVRCVLIFMI